LKYFIINGLIGISSLPQIKGGKRLVVRAGGILVFALLIACVPDSSSQGEKSKRKF
jgi:hypothetical protein